MNPFLTLACIISLVAAEVQFQHPEEWQLWKSQHGKNYGSDIEELDRHLVWVSNRQYINGFNANSDIFGFTLAMNTFGDMTDSEFEETYLSPVTPHPENVTKIFEPPSDVSSYPESIDWRTKGAVGGVKDQGQCGSSYAFSAMGVLEGAWALAHGKLTLLSEQNIIDCSITFGNYGCKGGNMYNAYLYTIANEGVDASNSYPYKGKQNSCSFSREYIGAQMSGSVIIKQGSESDLLAAVASVGPVSVAVDGRNKAFRFYSSGVYDSPWCSSTNIQHAMVLTGYGSYSGTKYWLIKNSWSESWGMNGYIMMARDRYNQCGIATDASYPTL